MIKRLFLIVLLLFVAQVAYAEFEIGLIAASYNTAGRSSLGAGLSFELPKMFNTLKTSIEILNLRSDQYSLLPVTVTGAIKPAADKPFYYGFGIGSTVVDPTATDSITTMSYSIFAGFEGDPNEKTSLFVQVGYEHLVGLQGGSGGEYSGTCIKTGFRFNADIDPYGTGS